MIEQNRNQLNILQESLKHAQKQAAKAQSADQREEYRAQASELVEELSNLEILICPQYLGDDATPESIALLLNDNAGRLALLSPEGDVFDLMAGRYSSNGAPNLGVYLKGHAGDDIRVNRANRDFTARYIHKPALSILTAQAKLWLIQSSTIPNPFEMDWQRSVWAQRSDTLTDMETMFGNLQIRGR